MPFNTIIFDEVTRLSNHRTKQSKAAKFLKAERKFALTGTPINNTPMDLHGIYSVLLPGLLGSFYEFRSKYIFCDYWGNPLSYHDLDKVFKLIKPYFLRRTKEQVMPELPQKITTEVIFELNNEERKIYNAIKQEILAYINLQALSKIDAGTINMVLVKMTRLMQVCNSLELIGDSKTSSKIEMLKDFLENIDGKAVLYTKFSKFADILERELAQYKPLKITGAVKERQPLIDLFNQKDDNRLIIITDAGAYGINLHERCSTIVMLDLPWALGKMNQITDRIHRIGQKNTVLVYEFICRNSISEFVKSVLHAKKKTAEELLGDIKRNLVNS